MVRVSRQEKQTEGSDYTCSLELHVQLFTFRLELFCVNLCPLQCDLVRLVLLLKTGLELLTSRLCIDETSVLPQRLLAHPLLLRTFSPSHFVWSLPISSWNACICTLTTCLRAERGDKCSNKPSEITTIFQPTLGSSTVCPVSSIMSPNASANSSNDRAPVSLPSSLSPRTTAWEMFPECLTDIRGPRLYRDTRY